MIEDRFIPLSSRAERSGVEGSAVGPCHIRAEDCRSFDCALARPAKEAGRKGSASAPLRMTET